MVVRTINEKFPDNAIVSIINDIRRSKLLFNLEVEALKTPRRNRMYNPACFTIKRKIEFHL